MNNDRGDYIPTREAVAHMKDLGEFLGKDYKRRKLKPHEISEVNAKNVDFLLARMPGLTPEAREQAKKTIQNLSQ